MNYYIHDGELYNQEELQHYGVLGMRWGIRRGRPSTAFRRATKKAKRIERKTERTKEEAAKLQAKAAKKMSRARNADQFTKALQMQSEAAKLSLKATKLEKKGSDWTKAMEREFANVKVADISSDALERGKKYAYVLNKTTTRSMRDYANDTYSSLQTAKKLEKRNTKNVEELKKLDKKIIEKQNSKPTDADRAKHEKLLSEQRKIQLEVNDLANRNSWLYKNNTREEVKSDAYKEGKKYLNELIAINNRIITNRYEEP